MTNEAILQQIETKGRDTPLNIHFKQRNTIVGLFIRENDYDDLKSKNLWRIVTRAHIEEWRKTRDISLCRIFNGAEFTKLSEVD